MNKESQQQNKSKKVLQWIKNHKYQITLGLAGVTAISAVALFKIKANQTSSLIQNYPSKNSDLTKTINEITNKTALPKTNFTGIKKTATGLGDDLLLSAQQVNKRLVEKGMTIKLPYGGYELTDLGKLFGEMTVKTNRYGKTFSNLEWDTSVINEIFSPDELASIESRKVKIRRILNA